MKKDILLLSNIETSSHGNSHVSEVECCLNLILGHLSRVEVEKPLLSHQDTLILNQFDHLDPPIVLSVSSSELTSLGI